MAVNISHRCGYDIYALSEMALETEEMGVFAGAKWEGRNVETWK
jgi:hypothetical protein